MVDPVPVVDAGISIARAERVYRFWLAHEGAATVGETPDGRMARSEPATRTATLAPAPTPPARATVLSPAPAPPARATALSPATVPAPVPAPAALAPPADEATERRSGERLEHDALVRQLRDADPKVRAAAFDKLKPQRR